jgi:hypothetical protein
MEKLEHELWIVQAANAVFGPMVNALLGWFGFHVADPSKPIPNYLVMVYLIVLVLIALAFVLRSRLSVDNPG